MAKAKATLLVRLFDGTRQPSGRETLVSLFDGAQRRVHCAYHPRPNVQFTIPVTNGPIDSYRVVAAAKDHRDAGQSAIRIKESAQSTVDLMLLPKRGRPVFEPLAALDRVHKKLRPLLEDFLLRQLRASDEGAYQRLQQAHAEGVMTLLNIASAFEGFTPPHPFDFVETLVELKPDRFFATARAAMVPWLESRPESFAGALSSLHPGAFISFKERRYPEGNVQFTFARTDDSDRHTLDSDIDLFASTASHFLLEVVPNDYLNPSSYTDPRRAYALRWMSMRRQKDATGVDFNPPYSLLPA